MPKTGVVFSEHASKIDRLLLIGVRKIAILQKITVEHWLLQWLGKISYEIFLIHPFWISIIGKYITEPCSYIMLVVMLTIVSAALLLVIIYEKPINLKVFYQKQVDPVAAFSEWIFCQKLKKMAVSPKVYLYSAAGGLMLVDTLLFIRLFSACFRISI